MAQKVQAFSSIRHWLLENRSWVYDKTAMSPCLVHGEKCFCHAGFRHEVTEEEVIDSNVSPPAVLSSSESTRRPWAVSTAGVTCVAWSNAGKCEGAGHISELFHHIWQVERIAMMESGCEDIGFMECTPRYPAAQRLQEECGEVCEAVWVVAGSHYMGFPALRERVLGALLNRKTVRWCGPAEQKDIEREFTQLFSKSVEMSGGSLLTDTDEERWAKYVRMADNRHKRSGRTFSVAELQALDSWELLMVIAPPGTNQRLDEWYTHMEQCHPMMPGEAFLCDIDHHPNTRSTGGREFPSQLTHGTIMAITAREQWKIATIREHLSAQGFHALPAQCEHFVECPVVKILHDLNLKDGEMKALCGNGMHLQTQAAWMLYVFCNISEVTTEQQTVEESDNEWH